MTLEDLGQLFLDEIDVAAMLCSSSLLVVFARILMAFVESKSIKPVVNYVAFVKCIVYGSFLLLIYLSEKMILKQPIKEIGFMNFFAVLFAFIEFTDNACELLVKPVVVVLKYRFYDIVNGTAK